MAVSLILILYIHLFAECHTDAQTIVLIEQGIEQSQGAVGTHRAYSLEDTEQTVALIYDIDGTGIIHQVSIGREQARIAEFEFLRLGVKLVCTVKCALSGSEGTCIVLVEGNGT